MTIVSRFTVAILFHGTSSYIGIELLCHGIDEAKQYILNTTEVQETNGKYMLCDDCYYTIVKLNNKQIKHISTAIETAFNNIELSDCFSD